jgi:hypothetical protein
MGTSRTICINQVELGRIRNPFCLLKRATVHEDDPRHNRQLARSGMGAIPEAQSPRKAIAAYAKDLDIVVFNGHVHTTEVYEVDGVKYLLLGGGGAEQDPILPGRTHITVPEGYPLDQYGKARLPTTITTSCT